MGKDRSRVRCMECGVRVPRSAALRVVDERQELIGWLCRECE